MTMSKRFRRILRDKRGSALLVSLMVIVGLSLLGLGFVAISETESAIAKNQQNALQTQAIAEAGAKMVVEWFQDPVWGRTSAATPRNDPTINTNLAAIKTVRTIPGYNGVYKPRASQWLFDKPFRPGFDDRFFGNEDSADIMITRTTDSTTIDNFNNLLLGTGANDKASGEVTEIRISAPPIVGGTLTSNGATPPKFFWAGGQRYGVATIMVKAQQFRDPVNHTGILASHSVRLVVGELPLPIPAGPIQGDASVSFGGNFYVHWGMETSRTTLNPSRSLSSLPWANAYERPHFEHGYEQGSSIASIQITSGGAGYASAPTVTVTAPSGAGFAGTATVSAGAVTGVTITNRGTGYPKAPPNGPPTVTFTGGGGAGATGAVAVAAEAWPLTSGQYDNQNFFKEVLNKTFDDPWYGTRAVGDNLSDGATPQDSFPQCYPYVYTADEVNDPTYAFQWQDSNVYANKKKVIFPSINYDFWKRIAQQGRGYKGLYYFNHTGGGNFQLFNNGSTDTLAHWANTQNNNMGPGVYFFDSNTGNNPQVFPQMSAQKQAELTPAEKWNSAAVVAPFMMEGFVYINSLSIGTTGIQNKQAHIEDANFPGEPFRDIGYPIWDTTNNIWKDCGGSICRSGVGDGTFNYQDLNGNGRFDVVVMSSPAWNSYDSAAVAHAAGSIYVVKTWKTPSQATQDYGAPCTVPAMNYDGTNAAATDCSEPHEPFLNVIYPTTPGGSCTIGWEAPGAQTYRPKGMQKGVTPLTPVDCSSPTSPSINEFQENCTTNAYDVDGAQVPMDIMMRGIIYNEGQFGSQGNAWYYGSVLIQDDVGGTGTADVWFDEKLIKGSWAPPGMPRVMVFSEQTDEISQ